MDQSWWGAMSSVEHVYWIIAIAASTILAVQLIIACISGLEFHIGSDLGSHDVGHHDIDMPHFQLLTVRNIVAFFALFGWSGLAFYHGGFHIGVVILLSFICGFIMMVITALIFLALSKMQSSGNLDYAAAKGLKAVAYLRFQSWGHSSTSPFQSIFMK
jgi:hypothetical protein